VQISKDAATDQLLVVTPIKGSPAFRVETPMSRKDQNYERGLWAGDLITTVKRKVDSEGNPLPSDKTLREISTKGMPLSQAVKLILGQEGTEVTLTVQREGIKEPFDVTIKRGQVVVESVLGARRKPNGNWDYLIDSRNKIGYIRLNNFARNSYREMEAV